MKTRCFLLLITCCCLSLLLNCGGSNLLINPGFEDKDPDKTVPNQWLRESYRDWVIFKADDTVKHSGKYSLLIENTQPNDSAFFQTIELAAGTEYELSGWIKTEGVQPSTEKNPPNLDLGANLCAAITFPQVWHTGQHQGTSDWTHISVKFTPDEKKAYGIKARLGMWGNVAQGKVWFDDLKLVELGKKGAGTGGFLLIVILILAGVVAGFLVASHLGKQLKSKKSCK